MDGRRPCKSQPPEEVSAEMLIVITAAVTSFLGKQVRIRSAKMLQSPYEIVNPWAQQGRVIVQASHTLRSWGRADECESTYRTRSSAIETSDRNRRKNLGGRGRSPPGRWSDTPPNYGPYSVVRLDIAVTAVASRRTCGPSNPMATSTKAKVCRSPVAGIVIGVNIQPGQQLQTDDLMLVLEAMKMETNVTAPSAGIVKPIKVQPQDPVKVNQVLVEFE